MGFLNKFKKIYFWVFFVWPILKYFFPKITVLSSIDTLEKIQKTHCSCVRLGDGEFGILRGIAGPGFQKTSDTLRRGLYDVLTNGNEKILLCVPEAFQYNKLHSYTKRARYHWIAIMCKFFPYLRHNLRKDYSYGNALVSRPYVDQKDKGVATEVFHGFKKNFSDRDLIIVEGEKTRFGVGNDLLSGAKSVRRIIAPAKNAFDKYKEIYAEAIRQPRDSLVLVALGPTAKLLVADLTQDGFQVLDVGHLDIEYEWYLQKSTKKIPIQGKYVNEVKKGRNVKDDIDLSQYNKEIIVKIE